MPKAPDGVSGTCNTSEENVLSFLYEMPICSLIIESNAISSCPTVTGGPLVASGDTTNSWQWAQVPFMYLVSVTFLTINTMSSTYLLIYSSPGSSSEALQQGHLSGGGTISILLISTGTGLVLPL